MKAAIEARLSAAEQTRLNNDYSNQVSDAAARATSGLAREEPGTVAAAG